VTSSSHDDFPTFVIVFQRIPKAAVVFTQSTSSHKRTSIVSKNYIHSYTTTVAVYGLRTHCSRRLMN